MLFHFSVADSMPWKAKGLNNPELITLAICNSQNGFLLVSEIYEFIETHFPKKLSKCWKSTIRHSLLKVERVKRVVKC